MRWNRISASNTPYRCSACSCSSNWLAPFPFYFTWTRYWRWRVSFASITYSIVDWRCQCRCRCSPHLYFILLSTPTRFSLLSFFISFFLFSYLFLSSYISLAAGNRLCILRREWLFSGSDCDYLRWRLCGQRCIVQLYEIRIRVDSIAFDVVELFDGRQFVSTRLLLSLPRNIWPHLHRRLSPNAVAVLGHVLLLVRNGSISIDASVCRTSYTEKMLL